MVADVCNAHREMYTERISSSVRKLYITQTHNKHAGPYTCSVLDQLQQLVVHRTVTLLLYRKISTVHTCIHTDEFI